MTLWEAQAHVEYLAHHMLLLAIPAFLPAIVVVGVILYVALRDRRNGGDAAASQQSDAADKKRD
ncbi:hypothetical protein AWB92_27065 [Mycobacterium sp. IEC1808]|uniref:hypothetical protein n=1 Tax=Mycobacterium sp. IEC1808 TaxID=1743230 RepID=UPI000A16340E|nr:hypothetical protein [Mycobacterium sp. IEC1808]ORW85166.1 hypothetical protein AWB92_27065 [Mycobacterium sp. IEC1808]